MRFKEIEHENKYKLPRFDSFLFEIPMRLPGMNEISNEARRHWAAGHKQKQKYTQDCADWITIKGVPQINFPIEIIFTWIEPNKRRDLDNIRTGAKFILDGLVLARKLKNDGRKFIQKITDIFPEPDPENPRIEIELKRIKF